MNMRASFDYVIQVATTNSIGLLKYAFHNLDAEKCGSANHFSRYKPWRESWMLVVKVAAPVSDIERKNHHHVSTNASTI